jgi:hypothetical protein
VLPGLLVLVKIEHGLPAVGTPESRQEDAEFRGAGKAGEMRPEWAKVTPGGMAISRSVCAPMEKAGDWGGTEVHGVRGRGEGGRDPV